MTTVNITKATDAFVPVELEFADATETSFGVSEDFSITPESSDDRTVIIVNNANASGRALTVKFKAGDYMSVSDTKEYSVSAGSSAVIAIDSAFVKNNDGSIVLTATPDFELSLTSCQFSVACVSFRQVETR